MEKTPIRRSNTNIEPADRKTEMEILDPVQRMNPFISFKYSSREISSTGGKTYVKAKEKSFVDGKFKSEEFEGTLDSNVYSNMVGEMQKLFFNQLSALMKPFSLLLPFVSRDKDR